MCRTITFTVALLLSVGGCGSSSTVALPGHDAGSGASGATGGAHTGGSAGSHTGGSAGSHTGGGSGSDASTGGLGGAGGIAGQSGGGSAGRADASTGGNGGLWNAEEATAPEECVFAGAGGTDCPTCSPVTIDLSSTVARTGVEARVETSTGDVWDTAVDAGSFWGNDPWLELVGDPLQSIVVKTHCELSNSYYPAWVDVVLTRNGATLVSERLDSLTYRCIARTVDDWCWEAAPVTLTVP